eukprot:COSAG04_NODE_2960_length_3344_cov_1.189214_3_plen_73_part_00
MRTLMLLLLGTVPLVQAGGLSSCRCLTSYPAGVTVNSDGQPIVTIEGVRPPRTLAVPRAPHSLAPTAQPLHH